MVEVRAELHGLGVYIAGERVTCAIVFTNQGAMEEIIAWAGAQLHCQYCYREDIVRVDFSQLPLSSPINDTAFVPNRGERGQTLLSTPASVLFCNLTLQPGESKTVMYTEQVPPGGPPTFSGRLVKYIYKLAVGAQKPNCPTQIIRIPFRLMTIPESLYSNPVAPSPKDANPFLAAEVMEHPSIDLALQNLAMETSKRTSMNYTLKNAHGILGRISLFKPSYKLGEDVTGVFDLTSTTVACLQFSVVLQCVEEVSKESLQPSAVNVRSVSTAHARHQECCHNTLQTHFQLPIPLSVTQSFQNKTVTVRWQLRFEFLTSRVSPQELTQSSPMASLSGSQAELRRSLQPTPVDTMTWELPITILPTLPAQAEERTPSYRLTL